MASVYVLTRTKGWGPDGVTTLGYFTTPDKLAKAVADSGMPVDDLYVDQHVRDRCITDKDRGGEYGACPLKDFLSPLAST